VNTFHSACPSWEMSSTNGFTPAGSSSGEYGLVSRPVIVFVVKDSQPMPLQWFKNGSQLFYLWVTLVTLSRHLIYRSLLFDGQLIPTMSGCCAWSTSVFYRHLIRIEFALTQALELVRSFAWLNDRNTQSDMLYSLRSNMVLVLSYGEIE